MPDRPPRHPGRDEIRRPPEPTEDDHEPDRRPGSSRPALRPGCRRRPALRRTGRPRTASSRSTAQQPQYGQQPVRRAARSTASSRTAAAGSPVRGAASTASSRALRPAARRTASSRPTASSPAYGQYGASAVPAQPPHVIIAAVLGFIFGALGVLVTLVLFIGGAFATGAAAAPDDEIPGSGALAGAVGGVADRLRAARPGLDRRHDLGLGVGADRPQPRDAAGRRARSRWRSR